MAALRYQPYLSLCTSDLQGKVLLLGLLLCWQIGHGISIWHACCASPPLRHCPLQQREPDQLPQACSSLCPVGSLDDWLLPPPAARPPPPPPFLLLLTNVPPALPPCTWS